MYPSHASMKFRELEVLLKKILNEDYLRAIDIANKRDGNHGMPGTWWRTNNHKNLVVQLFPRIHDGWLPEWAKEPEPPKEWIVRGSDWINT